MTAPVALALSAGMVGALNPCGFSLLPAYVGVFVRGDATDVPIERRLVRAVVTACAATAGFVVVFVGVGLLVASVASSVQQDLPWVTVGIGALLVLAGMFTAAGRPLRLPVPSVGMTKGRNVGAMVVYGMVYAATSLSCTLGPFLAITATAFDGPLVDGVATFLAYSLGMGTILALVSVATAVTRPGPVRRLRIISRYIPRLGGLLMIVAGSYAIWYARWELAVFGGDLRRGAIVDTGERLRLRILGLINGIGAGRLAGSLIVALAIAVWTLGRRRRPPSGGDTREDTGGVLGRHQ